MKLILLGEGELRRMLPMADAVQAMKDAFAAYSRGEARVPMRMAVPGSNEGTMLVKPASLPDALGAKLVSVFPGNRELGRPVVTGLVVLLDPATGEPTAICDGTFLTAWRTGAASGAATDLLARPDARVGAVFGCAAQGRTQVEAIDAVRDLDEIRLFARTASDVQRMVAELQPRTRARLVAATSADEALHDADVVCAATNSPTPIFDGTRLKQGAHLNGVGSFTAAMREIDGTTVNRARIYVDSIESAVTEAGDLLQAESEGHTRRADWVELGSLVDRRSLGRVDGDDVTFFKSVGLAVQDMVAGARALERLQRSNSVRTVDL